MLKQLSQATNITFQEKLINSRVQIISNLKPDKKQNKQGQAESFGTIIYKPEIYAYFLVVTLHSINYDDIENIIIKCKNIPNHKLKSTSFYKCESLDIAIAKIQWAQLDFNYLLSTDDISKDLKICKNKFNFIINDKSKVCDSYYNNIKYLRLNNKTPSIIFKQYKYGNDIQNQVLLKLSDGLSGLLSYNYSNQVDGIFLAITKNQEFQFLPMIYVDFMIKKITFDNSNKNLNLVFLPIKGTIKDKKVFITETYNDIEKNDFLVKIDGITISERGTVNMYGTELLLDQYIMLCRDIQNYCEFTLERGDKIIKKRINFDNINKQNQMTTKEITDKIDKLKLLT